MSEEIGKVEVDWYDDPGEVVEFARWFFDGATARAGEVIDVFEKPWKWNEEYQGMKAEKKAETKERHDRAIAKATVAAQKAAIRKPRSEWDEETRGREANERNEEE